MSNKTSDENVVNDIKILNKFCEYEDAVVLTEDALEEVQDAMQNILAEREQKDKRIKELEEELIFIKARQIKTMNNVSDEAKAKIYDSFDKIFYDDIDKKQKLQAILDTEEFVNKYDCGKFNNGLKLVIFLAKEQIDSIPKQVVIDKMEKLNKEIKSCDEIDAIFKIKQQQVLQELLEGERK